MLRFLPEVVRRCPNTPRWRFGQNYAGLQKPMASRRASSSHRGDLVPITTFNVRSCRCHWCWAWERAISRPRPTSPPNLTSLCRQINASRFAGGPAHPARRRAWRGSQPMNRSSRSLTNSIFSACNTSTPVRSALDSSARSLSSGRSATGSSLVRGVHPYPYDDVTVTIRAQAEKHRRCAAPRVY